MTRCKCGRMVMSSEPTFPFCSDGCQTASVNRTFKTYVIDLSVIVNAPDDTDAVQQAIELNDTIRYYDGKQSSVFTQIVEVTNQGQRSRSIDIQNEVFKILSNQNQSK